MDDGMSSDSFLPGIRVHTHIHKQMGAGVPLSDG